MEAYMPKYKPGYSADGTPKQLKQPETPSGRKYGTGWFSIPQPKPSDGRHWVSESSGTDRDGMQWTIPGHWSDTPSPAPIHELEMPTFKSTHWCKMNGAFIVFGAYVQIFDNEVPARQRSHKLYLKFGGLGGRRRGCGWNVRY